MVANLRCYERAASQLKRHCGPKHCGPYSELEISLSGFGQRCRTLLCDLSCTQSVLVNQCGRIPGMRASKFLTEYTRIQVIFSRKFNIIKLIGIGLDERHG